MTGDVLDQSNEIPDEAAVLQVVKDHFTGDIIQTPPLISAVKIGGKASYRRVRVLGETPVLPERKVEVLQFEISQSGDRGKFSFRLKCSPGTYIRSIARDLGRRLGCGGCVESLCREASSPFELKMARKIEELSESDMLPWSALFPGLPRYECTSEELDRLAHGDQRPVDGIIRRRKAEVCPENRALYGSPGSGAASGLLVREDGKWRSALYIE